MSNRLLLICVSDSLCDIYLFFFLNFCIYLSLASYPSLSHTLFLLSSPGLRNKCYEMGLSYRVGSAALLILVIFLITRHLLQVQDSTGVQPFWQVNSPEPAAVPEQPPAPEPPKQDMPAGNVKENKQEQGQSGGSGGKTGKTGGTVWKGPTRPGRDRPKTRPATVGSGNRKVFDKKPVYETTPIIVPNDRTLVMAKLSHEDTSWVGNDLNE